MSSTPQTDALLGQAKTMATMGNPSNAVNTITGAANKFATANNLQQNAAPTAVERFSGLFPTAGNVAGGVGGGILGSILAGEIADPAGGGLVTGGAAILSKVLPYLGGIFGAGTGQTAGKATQNVVQNKPFTNQLGSNFLEGAASQAAGESIGKGASVLGRKVISPFLQSTAGKLIAGQLKGATGDLASFAKTINDSGITDIRKAPDQFSLITGSNGAATQGVIKALQQSGNKVDMGGFLEFVRDELNNATMVGKNTSSKVNDQAIKTVQNVMGGKQGMIGPQLSDPAEVLAELRKYEAQYQKYANMKNATPESKDLATVYGNISKRLNDVIFNPFDSEANLPIDTTINASLKKDVINQLQGNTVGSDGKLSYDASKDLSKINPQLFKNVNDKLNGAKTIGDLRGLQSEYVGASIASREALAKQAAQSGLSGANVVRLLAPALGLEHGGLAGGILGGVGSFLSAPSGERLLTKGAASLAAKTGGEKEATSTIGKVLSKLPAGYPKALAGATALGANASNLSNPGTSNNQGAIMNPAAGAGAPNLGAATQAAAPTGTPSINPNVATPIALMELAAMTDPQIFQQMGGADTLNNLLKPVTAAQTAQSGLNTLYGNLAQGAGSQGGAGTPQLGGLYAQAGGGQGALSGGLSGTLSRLFGGGETSRFRQQLQSEQQALQDALSAAGIKTPVNLPDITSSPQAAAAQLQYYQSLLNQIGGAQPTNSPGGGFIPQSVLNSIPAAQ